MTDNPLARFDRAAAVADGAISATKPDQLDDPSPCSEWSVRQLINHVVTGNLLFASLVSGGERPDRATDHLGDDPLGAFRDGVLDLRNLFSAEGVLTGTYETPFGPGPGALLVHMRTIEMTVHGWDIAKGTGQSTDLDPELAEACLESLRQMLERRGGSSPFGEPKPVGGGATAADRLAAYAGRDIG